MTKNKMKMMFWVGFMFPAGILGFLVEITMVGYKVGKDYVAEYMEQIGK